jgi:hypothetical protein
LIHDSMPVGIVLERREIDNPWQDHQWQVVAVIPGAAQIEGWQMLAEGPGWTRYHAATLEVELFGKETEGYRYNLSIAPPSVYVVLRPDEENEAGVAPFLATVCPYEAQDYMDADDEVVEPVPMPGDMIGWVGRFVDEHHVDEPFHKRKRKPHKGRELEAQSPPRRNGRIHGAQ